MRTVYDYVYDYETSVFTIQSFGIVQQILP